MEGKLMARYSIQIGRFLLATAIAAATVTSVHATPAQIERGKYLVTVGGCSDCHTPGTFLGHPDMSKYLGGSDVGFAIPGLGVFAGRNLTPDKETGLGNWTTEQIVKALTTGVRPDGRTLAPVMPYAALSHLTLADALAAAAYLKGLKPVANAVAGPFGPNDRSTIFVFDVLPADVYNGLPKPPGPK
jgi:mono/diheme cytochrome c family protein